MICELNAIFAHIHTWTHNRCHLKVDVPHGHKNKVRFTFRHKPDKYLAFKPNGDSHKGGGGDWYVPRAGSLNCALAPTSSTHSPQVSLPSAQRHRARHQNPTESSHKRLRSRRRRNFSELSRRWRRLVLVGVQDRATSCLRYFCKALSCAKPGSKCTPRRDTRATSCCRTLAPTRTSTSNRDKDPGLMAGVAIGLYSRRTGL